MEKYRFSKTEQEIYEGMQVPFAVYQFLDKHVVTIALSQGFLEVFGYTDRGQAYFDMDNNMYVDTHPDDIMRIEEAAVRFATEDTEYDVVYRSRKHGGAEYFIVHAYGRHVVTDDGVRLAYIWYADEGEYSEDDKKETKLYHELNKALREESIIKSSHYDYLTGLPNMTFFFEIAKQLRDSAVENGCKPALLYLDLCGLKYYNHKHGFAEGDNLLRSFAKLLAKTFGNDKCCHIGQDHFAAFSIESVLESKLDAVFAEFRRMQSDTLPVRVGIYRDTDDKVIPVSVACDRAKLACDSLRGSAESAYAYYRSEFRDRIIKKQYIIENFEKALAEERIEVYYQPIIRAVNGRVCDEEALSRWHDPDLGLLSPADFIPALEESKLIYKLDLYLLEHVLEKMKKQVEFGLTMVPHSINLSRSDFESCDIVEEIRKRVDAAGIDHGMISIEITESVIGKDFDYMKERVERFRALGFPVWMDDFGVAYSSLDLLQSLKFDLIKFDMGFMQKLDENENGKVILTELMIMATSLGLDTVCEGVETEEQVRFLREIGCSKLQGYYYCRPISYDQLLERYRNGKQIGFENPLENDYYKFVGGINLYDLSVLAGGEDSMLNNTFDTLPMGVIEVMGEKTRFLRSNKSYRDFIKRYIGLDLSYEGSDFTPYNDAFMTNIVRTCCERGLRSYYDESMPDGSVVHSFARRIGINPVNGCIAVAIAVLSITNSDEEGATYANIARALASDYYNIYYVNLNDDSFIEYTSPAGSGNMAMERHGENFFEECRQAAYRIYEEDREPFFATFSKENIIRELAEHGAFNTAYRLIENGVPVYMNMKITRMAGNHIILGISVIDSQMKQKAYTDELRKERDVLARIMALSDSCISLYVINPDTDHYIICNPTDAFSKLGTSIEGDDFFGQSIMEAKNVIYREDYNMFVDRFNKRNVMNELNSGRVFEMRYRLMLNGEPTPVYLRIAKVSEGGKEKLIAGVRTRKERFD